MKIRSITYFLKPDYQNLEASLSPTGEFLEAARGAFQRAGYEVQTTRLATTPFPLWFPEMDTKAAQGWAREIEAAARSFGIDYISLGPALPSLPQSYALVPPVLAVTETVFFSGSMTTSDGYISLPAVRSCAEVIVESAPLTPDGFANLRFAALANVPPGAPFFPAAYHAGDIPGFALALEAADLAVSAFENASSLKDARQKLVVVVEQNAKTLSQTAGALSSRFALPFGGLDFSMAPYPEELRSLGTAIERIGAPSVGQSGTLAATAILADTLDQARFPRAGFCGMFLPVMEDAVLGARAASGLLNLKDLLLYSSVCGTGLDTIPLPGDASADEVAPILLDLAALAHRLDKPLTARLMPIPGAQAGDFTGFDFDYFTNSQVMSIDSGVLNHYLSGEESFQISPRQR
jgi:uncharacterized protein (UPF0210 family)